MAINFVLLLALVFLCLAAFKTNEPSHLAFGWAGLALWMLVEVFGGVSRFLH